tara:strand:- start:989 stop:1162 length:174 start_codon:yes stop_codon:yes gene_type:complete
MKYKERKKLGALKDYSQRRREGKLNEQIQTLKEQNSVLKERLKEHNDATQKLVEREK